MPWKTKTFRPAGARSEAERKAEFDKRRGSADERGYGAKWRKLRAAILSDEPLCRACHAAGYVTPASEVDHIIPHKGNQKLFWSMTNLQPLCKSCHSRKTAREDSRFACTRSGVGGHPSPSPSGGRG